MKRLRLRTLPYGNLLRRRLGRPRALGDAALSEEILQPEEVVPAQRIVRLTGDEGRATSGVPGYMPLQQELEILTRSEVRHAPVLRFELANCLVHPGGVEFAGGSLFKGRQSRLSTTLGVFHEVESACYPMSLVSGTFFGHWLTDACSASLLGRAGEALLLDRREEWPNCQQYLQAFALTPEQGQFFFASRLSVFQDYGQGSSKQQRYAELRQRLAASAPDALAPADVYLRRGATGAARQIVNEDELVDRLVREGFEVFDVEGASVSDFYRRFGRARRVVSIDGSHQTHLQLMMPAGAKMLGLVPSDRFTLVHHGYAAAVGLTFGFSVLERAQHGYRADPGRVLDTLALLDR